MKLDQAIREAVASNDPVALEQVVNFMRFRMRWNARQSLGAALKSLPGLTADRWEEMMIAIDYQTPTLGG